MFHLYSLKDQRAKLRKKKKRLEIVSEPFVYLICEQKTLSFKMLSTGASPVGDSA